MKRFTLFSPIFYALLAVFVLGGVLPAVAPWWVGGAAGGALFVVAHALERWYVYPRTTAPVLEHEEISNSTVPTLPRLCVHAPWAGGCTRPECR